MLTKDAKIMLYTLYKEYLARRNAGSDRIHARTFLSDKSVHENFFPSWLLADVNDVMFELYRYNFLELDFADGNCIYDSRLSTEAISCMEQLPSEIIKSLAEFIAKFVP